MKKDEVNKIKPYKDTPEDEEDFFAFAFCPRCEEKLPMVIDTFEKKIENEIVSIEVAHCPRCDLVLNFTEDVEINLLTKEQAEELGWSITLEEEDEKS